MPLLRIPSGALVLFLFHLWESLDALRRGRIILPCGDYFAYSKPMGVNFPPLSAGHLPRAH